MYRRSPKVHNNKPCTGIVRNGGMSSSGICPLGILVSASIDEYGGQWVEGSREGGEITMLSTLGGRLKFILSTDWSPVTSASSTEIRLDWPGHNFVTDDTLQNRWSALKGDCLEKRGDARRDFGDWVIILSDSEFSVSLFVWTERIRAIWSLRVLDCSIVGRSELPIKPCMSVFKAFEVWHVKWGGWLNGIVGINAGVYFLSACSARADLRSTSTEINHFQKTTTM